MSTKKYRPRQLRAGFLPLSSLHSGVQLLQWFDFLFQNKLNAWAMLPVHEPNAAPYRTTGFGVAEFFGTLATDLATFFSASEIDIIRQQLTVSEQDWLLVAATYQALSQNFSESNWTRWPVKIRHCQPEILLQFQKTLHRQIEQQYQKQLDNLVSFRLLALFAKKSGLKLVGDLPFYLGLETFIPWSQPYLFQLDSATKEPSAFSGVPHHPTEPFTRQLWGHPLYDWEVETSAITQLFNRRLRHLKTLGFHTIRFDHVMGFFHYGSLKGEDRHQDQRLSGPGPGPLLYLVKRLRALRLNFYFEDLAASNRSLLRFMSAHHIPGLQVLTLSFDQQKRGFIENWANLQTKKLSSAYPAPVIYTSSHDTPTLISWLGTLTESQRRQLAKINHLQLSAKSSLEEQAVLLRDLALKNESSPLIIVPIQDFLLQTIQLNQPGTPDEDNWQYVFPL